MLKIPRLRPLVLVLAMAVTGACGDLSNDGEVTGSYLVPSTSATYNIVGVQSSKCVEVQNGSTALVAPLQIATCNNTAPQQFRAEVLGSGFRLRNVGSSLCADVEGRSTADGARLVQYTCGTGTNQQFSMPDVSSGIVQIVAAHSGKVWDVSGRGTADGTPVIQWASSGGTNQQFRFQTAGTTPPPPPPPPSGVVGWASTAGGTSGGGNATATVVTSLSALSSAVSGSTARVVQISGTISGSVTVGSNKTIQGASGALFRGSMRLSASANVIIQNLRMVGNNCTDGGCEDVSDTLTIDNASHNIWVDHCDISDGSDGNLDIRKASDLITISWTKFSYSGTGRDHRFSNLFGSSDSDTGDRGHLRITLHHDWWANNVVERMPRVRFGQVHLFNNYFNSTGNNYCVRGGFEARVLLENNYFKGVDTPHEIADTTAQIVARGNVYDGTSGARDTAGSAFTPPYGYTLDAASGVSSAVPAGIGPH
jgi:pectate lyase